MDASENIGKSIGISKGLEVINFKTLLIKNPELKTRKNEPASFTEENKFKKLILKTKILPEKLKQNETTQFELFQRAMKFLFIIGCCLGLNPVLGILKKDISKMRFTMVSWRFLLSILIGLAQGIAAFLCLYRLLRSTVSVGALAYFSFYITTCFTTFLFLRVAHKWSNLVKKISNSTLNEYIDPYVTLKCNIAAIIILTLAFVEHILSVISKVTLISECSQNITDVYSDYIKSAFPWLFELEVTPSLPLGIVLQVLTIISTFNWNYSDLFIICMSIYLASILRQINIKVIWASEKRFLPSSYWRYLREDYNRATRLVRSFDEVISGIVFISFASNLFFVCLQLYNILTHGVKTRHTQFHFECAHDSSGAHNDYKYTMYLMFSALYLFARSLAVALIAAKVHSASLVPGPALYNVPSTAFCSEVQRFSDQVHGATVALSGLQFFYVTKELVLSVASTVVTYELVLLQFDTQELRQG